MDASGCGAPGLGSFHARPTSPNVCVSPNLYEATWSAPGSGSGVAAIRRGAAVQRIVFTCFRGQLLTVSPNQKLFGVQLLFNVSEDLAAERGGPCQGCPTGVCLMWNSGTPLSAAGVPTALLEGTGFVPGIDNRLSFNGAEDRCSVTPVSKRTWGQIKSLYR